MANPDRLLAVIREELEEVRERYADERRTEIVEDYADLTIEDLIPREELVVTLSQGGYAKAQPVTTYQAQHRGGRGRAATRVKEEDFCRPTVRREFPRHIVVLFRAAEKSIG